MKRHIVTVAAATFLAAISTAAWAQPTQDGGSRAPGTGGGSGTGSGTVASGGGGGGSSAAGSGGGGGSSATTSSGSTGGGGGSIGWDRPGVDFPRTSAPMRGPGAAGNSEGQRAVPRGGSGGGSGERAGGRPSGGGGNEGQRAVPRGGDAGDRGGDGGGRAAAGRQGTALTIDGGGREPAQGRSRAAVPTYSRPREGRVPIGTPVERASVPGGPVVPIYPSYPSYPYYPYYPYYGYGWYSGVGFGLGYFYDPFWYGYGGSGYPYYGGGSGGGYYSSRGYDTGSLKLKVQPRDAKVYVDGYFVGLVDSFDGAFQKLAVEAGTHRVEIRADGYEPAQFEVMVTPGETITYKGQLKRMIQ